MQTKIVLGTEPNYILASAPGLELHHQITIMPGGNEGLLERYRERQQHRESFIPISGHKTEDYF